jgi:hypothetical protein
MYWVAASIIILLALYLLSLVYSHEQERQQTQKYNEDQLQVMYLGLSNRINHLEQRITIVEKDTSEEKERKRAKMAIREEMKTRSDRWEDKRIDTDTK